MKVSIAFTSAAVLFAVLASTTQAAVPPQPQTRADYKTVEKNIKKSSSQLEKGLKGAPVATMQVFHAAHDVQKAVFAAAKGNSWDKTRTAVAAAWSVNKAYRTTRKVTKNLQAGTAGVQQVSRDLEGGVDGLKNRPTRIIKRSFADSGMHFANVGSELVEGVIGAGEGISDMAVSGAHVVRNGVVEGVEGVKGAGEGISDMAVSGAHVVRNGVVEGVEGVKGAGEGISDMAVSGAHVVRNGMVEGVEGVKGAGEGISDMAVSGAHVVRNGAVEVTRETTNFVGNAADAVANTAVRSAHGALDAVGGAVATTKANLHPLRLRRRFFGSLLGGVASVATGVLGKAGSVVSHVPGAQAIAAASRAATSAATGVIGKAGSVVSHVPGVQTIVAGSRAATSAATGVIGKAGSVVSHVPGVQTIVAGSRASLGFARDAASKVGTKVVNVGKATPQTIVAGSRATVGLAKDTATKIGTKIGVVGKAAPQTAIKEGGEQALKKGSEQVIKESGEQAVKKGAEEVIEVAAKLVPKTKTDKALLVGAGLAVGAGSVMAGNAIVDPKGKPRPETEKDPQLLQIPPAPVPAAPADVVPGSAVNDSPGESQPSD